MSVKKKTHRRPKYMQYAEVGTKQTGATQYRRGNACVILSAECVRLYGRLMRAQYQGGRGCGILMLTGEAE